MKILLDQTLVHYSVIEDKFRHKPTLGTTKITSNDDNWNKK